jgi:hypothetical protein
MERLAVAVDDCFEVAREAVIESGRRGVLSRKAKRFRKQKEGRLGGMDDGHRPRIVLNDNLGARAHSRQQRREVARGFRFGNVDYRFRHNAIIHRRTAYRINTVEAKFFWEF